MRQEMAKLCHFEVAGACVVGFQQIEDKVITGVPEYAKAKVLTNHTLKCTRSSQDLAQIKPTHL